MKVTRNPVGPFMGRAIYIDIHKDKLIYARYNTSDMCRFALICAIRYLSDPNNIEYEKEAKDYIDGLVQSIRNSIHIDKFLDDPIALILSGHIETYIRSHRDNDRALFLKLTSSTCNVTRKSSIVCCHCNNNLNPNFLYNTPIEVLAYVYNTYGEEELFKWLELFGVTAINLYNDLITVTDAILCSDVDGEIYRDFNAKTTDLPGRFAIPVVIKTTSQTIPINARKVSENVGSVSRIVKIDIDDDEVAAEMQQWRARR